MKLPGLGGKAQGGGAGGRKGAKEGVPVPSRKELMALRPLRNPRIEWEEREGRALLTVRHEGGGRDWKTRLASAIVPLPKERTVELDVLGTEVWRMLDGAHSIGDIVRELGRKHQLQPREAELSVRQYFKELGRRGYVGFIEAPEKGK